MGVGAYGAGIFHLYTHAFFKALLFLGSGAVIHALAGEQDLRHMGGLRKELPITYWTFLIGALAISGVPGLAGFFSKDEILGRTFTSGHSILWGIGLLTSLLTATYMFRVVFLAFHGERSRAGAEQARPLHSDDEHDGPDGPHAAHGAHLHDAPPAMAFALIVLAIGSVLAGYAGLGGRFEHFLEPSFAPQAVEAVADTTGELTLVFVSVLVAVGGILFATFFFWKDKAAADRMAQRFSGLHRVLMNKYYVDEMYDAAIVQPIRIVSEYGLWKALDVSVIDRIVNGVAETVDGASVLLRRLQTGSVRAYAASLFLGVVLILGYYLWP
jgi:NADH-quinone oxidoreductase subunit L